jgi:L-ascorbate metabolism protein UlaG (beta-lactamase superfamily)
VRITKFGHSCVRVSHGGRDLVIDPGVLTGPEAVDGAAGVLVTHEHPDHWTIEYLRAADCPVWTIAAVAAQIREADPAVGERVQVVEPGQQLDVLGYDVRVVGRKHAIIHPELTHFDNSGYVVSDGGTSLFHPGDSFEFPGAPVDVYCAPVSAPWAKMSELVNIARDIAAPRTLGIHDGVYSDFGLAIADDRFRDFVAQRGGTYARPAPGTDL